MKYTTFLIGAAAVAASAYTTLSNAQSGTPSAQETGSTRAGLVLLDEPPEVDDATRYLMVVDGMSRERALAQAGTHAGAANRKVAPQHDLGSYGSYLMVVDGMTHAEAAVAAANHDNPAHSRVASSHHRADVAR